MNPLRLLVIFLFLISFHAFPQIKLPRLISDGMVLQRETDLTIWGWASPGEKVTLTFLGQDYTADTPENGAWTLTLPSQNAGGPYKMTFVGTNTLTVKDILFGDVWLCSGQSNMELTMARVEDTYPEEIANANNDHIRQFEVPDSYNFNKPQEDLKGGSWKKLDSQNVRSFSAVAYFFAHDIYSKYKVPIGLINAALGGSPVESWISEEALKKFPTHYEELQLFKDEKHIEEIEKKNNSNYSSWMQELNSMDTGLSENWHSENLNDESWAEMVIPGYWANEGAWNVNGSMWFRKIVNLEANQSSKGGRLLLGRIVDADSVFINGQFVGTTSYQYPPRKYDIPKGILKEGKNSIAIRVINSGGKGGFVPDKLYKLIVGSDSLDLEGTWKYRLGAKMPPMGSTVFVRWKPGGLYNSMIAPITNYRIKGVLWYQGESNADNPDEYASLIRSLINDWRQRWNLGDFPFIIVQLPNFMEEKTEPSESSWAEFRQVQLEALEIENTGLAIAIDAGEWNDIHPLNKKVIGQRLALQAREIAYGEKNIVSGGPIIECVERKGNKLILTFSDVGSGLMVPKDQELKYFAIAGEDNIYKWSKAKIKDNKVFVWNDNVKNPIYVRYAWADNPKGANLYNIEGLPASPFEAKVGDKNE